jgi:hypothetical protein
MPQIIQKSITKNHEIWYQMASKMEPKSMPELIKINTKTGTEKEQENHENHVFLKCKNM